MKFPTYIKAYQYKGGFDKFIYDWLKDLGENPKQEPIPEEVDITITVKDENNNPISEATVTINNTTETTTNDGTCTFTLTPDTYTITTHKIGYGTITSEITTTEATSYNITLKEALVLIYSANEYTKNFATSTYTNTPLTYTGDIVINWGDGEVETYNGGNLTHEYVETGEYEIQIIGEITQINDYAFFQLNRTYDIILPNGITSIGRLAFAQGRMERINIPEGVTYLGDNCFDSCNYLSSLTIPSTVTTIRPYALACQNIKDYQLWWTESPVPYITRDFEAHDDTTFTIPKDTTDLYVSANYPSDKLVEREE